MAALLVAASALLMFAAPAYGRWECTTEHPTRDRGPFGEPTTACLQGPQVCLTDCHDYAFHIPISLSPWPRPKEAPSRWTSSLPPASPLAGQSVAAYRLVSITKWNASANIPYLQVRLRSVGTKQRCCGRVSRVDQDNGTAADLSCCAAGLPKRLSWVAAEVPADL